MPDITMCKGQFCPLRESCYRYTASPTPNWQSWFTETPYNYERKSCEYYEKNERKNVANTNG